jgi:hypothetical protein
MQERLVKYTAPRLIKDLEAKIASVTADLFAQKSTFQLEKTRKERLETMIENCTIKAPSDGIVVYAQPANAWGRAQAQIAEGVTVREGQTIINLPDPNHMQVKAKINESKVRYVRPGQRAMIRIDAFPDQVMEGTVAAVTPIPTQVQGPFSDVKTYYASVDINKGGFSGLRPGMSAEVAFELDGRTNVTRVPLNAIRWAAGTAFVAVPNGSDRIAWRKIEVGLVNPTHAEILSGVNPGESVIADPAALPAPDPRTVSDITRVSARIRTDANR